MVESLATVVSGGSSPRRAWEAVALTLPPGPLHTVAVSASRGGDPVQAAEGSLRRLPALRSLSLALAVCTRSGAPTADVLSALAAALRDLHDAALARRSAFAGPRATARILLALPVGGLGLGMLLGADPLAFLTGTASGRVLAVIGAALTVAGWWWMHRLLQRADPPPPPGVDPSVLLELIAGALRAGLPPAHAVLAVAQEIDGADAEVLEAYGRALAAGVPASLAATRLPAPLAPLGTGVVLAAEAGADLARVLRSAAADSRRGRARDAEARAAQLAVRLVLPTGLALLPAFVALGIVPTVVSLLGGAFLTDLTGALP